MPPGRDVRSPGAATKATLIAGLWTIAAALILLAPTMVWGRPFVFGDTPFYWGWGGDILDALRRPWPQPGQPWAAGRSLHGWGFSLHDTTRADLRFNLTWLTARSAFYAAPFHLVVQAGGLWLVAGLQALAAAWVVRVAVRAVAPGNTGLTYLGVVAALSAGSTLSFEVAYAMPDLFGGLAVLAACLLVAFPHRLSRAERWGLIGVIVYAVLAHAENGLNMAAAVLIGWVWGQRSGAGWRPGLVRTAPVAAALATGMLLAAGGAQALDWAFGQPVHMPPFAAGRVLADGGGEAYLRRVCPHAPLAACNLAGSPPAPIEYYLWVYPLEAPPSPQASDPIAQTLAQFDRLQSRHVTDAEADLRRRFVAEQWRLAFGAMQDDWSDQARGALVDAMIGVFNFGVDRNFDSIQLMQRGGWTQLRVQTLAILPGGVECARSAGGACGRYDLGATLPFDYGAVLLSLALIAACAVRKAWRPRDGLADFLPLALMLVVVNGVLCGVISGPFSRYQARVEWIVPLGALLLIVQWVARTRPDSPDAASPTAASAPDTVNAS